MTTTPVMRIHFLTGLEPVSAERCVRLCRSIALLSFQWSVEQKRKKRMKKAGVLKEDTESYDTLVQLYLLNICSLMFTTFSNCSKFNSPTQ